MYTNTAAHFNFTRLVKSYLSSLPLLQTTYLTFIKINIQYDIHRQ